MSLQTELNKERVLGLELQDYSLVQSGDAVGQAIATMQADGHNVCLVARAGRLVGILTDRDVVRKVIGLIPLDREIDEVMTADPVTVTPDYSAAEALWLMDRKGFRNLPVVDDEGQIQGNMTHHAVLRYLADRYPQIVWNQPPDPNQVAETPEGGD